MQCIGYRDAALRINALSRCAPYVVAMGATANGDDAAEIAASLRSLAPAGVRSGARSITERDVPRMLDDERDEVRSAVAKRRREFATGRVLLREVIGREVTIPVGIDRRPVLPPDVVGSLAHDEYVAVAAVAAAAEFAAVGIDIGRQDELEPDIVSAILRPDDEVGDPVLAFVLKEAAYKAWSGIGGRMLDHHEVRLKVAGNAFTATVQPDGVKLAGRLALSSRSWLALVVVPRRAVTRPTSRRGRTPRDG